MDRDVLIRAPRRLVTPRLRLESSGPDHAALFLAGTLACPPDPRFIGWADQRHDMAWAVGFCEWDRQFVERGEGLVFQALEQDSGSYVGRVDLHTFDFESPRCEVGYVGDCRLSGRGLMREAVLAVVELGFRLGLARIQALSDVRNVRALHFAEHALGFVREGVLRNYERDAQGRLGEQVMFAAYRPDAA